MYLKQFWDQIKSDLQEVRERDFCKAVPFGIKDFYSGGAVLPVARPQLGPAHHSMTKLIVTTQKHIL